jgi:predicted DNA repair protein MutK
MSSGLIALLDDLVALTKVAAASLDDAGAQAVKAGSKAAGIVIDDAAVTPRYVVGLAADRELPIVRKIATGSLKNKMLFLLPGALILSFFAPSIITPLLMIGGAFLCLEGYHKVADLVHPGHSGHGAIPDAAKAPSIQTEAQLEDERVGSAIQTDFILSAEIMAITLAAVTTKPLWMQASVLAIVGFGMTLLVYGAVALIVKADDAGVAMAKSSSAVLRAVGRGIVGGMPSFLKLLSFVGMIAMLWVGGGILIHGMHGLGWHAPEEMVHHAAEVVASKVPALHGPLGWLVSAGIAAVLGVLVGGIVNPLANRLIKPAISGAKRLFSK